MKVCEACGATTDLMVATTHVRKYIVCWMCLFRWFGKKTRAEAKEIH
ncbi:MAG: hypothetical protein WC373_17555 [Smithella sp.]